MKDSGPQTYRFTVNYNSANTKGEAIYRQHRVGDYRRGLPGGEVTWKNVTVAEALGATAAFASPRKRDFNGKISLSSLRRKNDYWGRLGIPPVHGAVPHYNADT